MNLREIWEVVLGEETKEKLRYMQTNFTIFLSFHFNFCFSFFSKSDKIQVN